MHSNKEIMMRVLTETPDQITDRDREQGRSARGRLGSDISLRILKGETLSHWGVLQARICNTETLETAFDLAVMASFPQSYSKIIDQDQIQERLNQCEDSVVGSGRVQLSVEVIECFYSAKWDCWFVKAIDGTNHAVMFPYRKQLQTGTGIEITGTVKGFSNLLSRLNRVKIIEQEAVA
jgi:hypothetical protein